jgi:hypothetical protein
MGRRGGLLDGEIGRMEDVFDEAGERAPVGRERAQEPGRLAAEGLLGGEGLGVHEGGVQGAADFVKVVAMLMAEVVVEDDDRAGEDDHGKEEGRGQAPRGPQGGLTGARPALPASQVVAFQ